MFSGDSTGRGQEEGEQQSQSLSSLLNTEPKYRAYMAAGPAMTAPSSGKAGNLEKTVDRGALMVDQMPNIATFEEGKVEDSWGLSAPTLSQFVKGQDQRKHFVQELSLNIVDVVADTAVELPLKPIYVEKYTSFASTSSPVDLLSCIKKHFDNARIDFEFLHADSKIEGLVGDGGRRCKFNVSLFQGDGEGEVLVEFQRRCGDILAFTSLYRSVLACLGQEKLIKGEKAKQIHQPVPSETEISSDLAELALADLLVDSSSVNSLFEMASCELRDVQKEGLSALASVSAVSKENQAVLVKEVNTGQLVGILKDVLGSEDEEVCHTGAVLLANVCSQEKVRTPVVDDLTKTIVELMKKQASLANRDTKRQLASALCLLSESHAGQLKSVPDLQLTLEKYKESDDSVLRDAVCKALERLVSVN